MDNKYIDAFFQYVTWQFKKSDIKIMEKEEFGSPDLLQLFPKLNSLLNKAIVFRIVLQNDTGFRLVCWENKDSIGGWLCQNCEYINTELLHLNLLKRHIGTIIESWGFDSIRDDLLCNMDRVLVDNVTYGIGAWKDYFKESCDDKEVTPQIKDEDYILVAEEANGNMTLCNKNNGAIVIFAPDHCFDNVEVYTDCPDYTFYKINNADGLTDYFELVAQQWLMYIK